MNFNPDLHHRRSIRLEDYDYTRAGAYFVTICTFERECLFGEVVEGVMGLNRSGEIVRDEWLMTDELRNYVVLDEFMVMPNHFHAVLMIDERRGTACRAPTVESFGCPVAGSLPTVIRSFKSAATKRINILRDNSGGPVWQRNYYDRVIRDERELDSIRQYITDNPVKWEEDENHPEKWR
jgi:REP element-mobilizing transposase RayT